MGVRSSSGLAKEVGGEASEAPPHLCAAEAGPPGGDLHRHHPAGDPQGPGLPALRAEDPPGHQRSPGLPPLRAPELASLGRPGREAAGLCAAHAAGGAGGLGPGAWGPRSSALLAFTPCGRRSLPVLGEMPVPRPHAPGTPAVRAPAGRASTVGRPCPAESLGRGQGPLRAGVEGTDGEGPLRSRALPVSALAWACLWAAGGRQS